MRCKKLTLHVTNSPFSEEQVKLINELLPQLTEQQKIWLTGYLSATQTALANVVATASGTTAVAGIQVAPAPVETKTATVLYGSQTGTAQGLAEKLAADLAQNGVEVSVSALSKFKTNNLKKVSNLFLVVSTHGEGEPPDNAIAFHEFIYGKRAPQLDHLNFSVLALGDSSYEFFCKTGIDFDEQFEKLGAHRLVPRVDCDLDYEEPAAKWFADVKAALLTSANATVTAEATSVEANKTAATYSLKNPYHAEVLANINLNGRGSNKETRHVELSLEGSGLTYEPGDSIGIIPQNEESLVTSLIQALGFNENEQVTLKDGTFALKDALQTKLEITALSKSLLQKIAAFTDNEELEALLTDDAGRKEFVYGRDLLDAVEKFGPFTWTAQSFVEQLRKIPPRLYSIASSQRANEDEVHLTIGKVSYEQDGRSRLGVTSGLVAERLEEGQKLPIYVHKNPNFKLPQDEETPIILIGAGTGIAPFRSFIEDRAEAGVEGKSWLFFGDQHFVTDFLYQTEWQRYLAEGALTKLDVAFSRDTEEKVYVQHRLLENAKEIYEWLEQCAVIYICGDEKTMAADVDKALHSIIEQQGNKTSEEAAQFIANLKDQQRYQRDVY